MTESARLLFFAGSTRQESYNRKLARNAYETARKRGFEADLLELADYPMPIYDAGLEEREGPPENARRLRETIRAYQGVFIASPEYNASVTPLLKNTLDWMSRVRVGDEPPLQLFKTRVFAIGAASPGGFGGMRSLITLRQILSLGMGALVLPEQVVVANAGSAFGDNGQLTNERAVSMLDAAMQRLGDAAVRFRP
ncbi:MAG: NADPH-dependent FMN reductase [Rhodomicrobiaceae bacterium]